MTLRGRCDCCGERLAEKDVGERILCVACEKGTAPCCPAAPSPHCGVEP